MSTATLAQAETALKMGDPAGALEQLQNAVRAKPADADSRLGPTLEAIVNGRYYRVPFARIRRIAIDVPADLRDVGRLPTHVELSHGGELVALMPARYPHTAQSNNGQLMLGRATQWEQSTPDFFVGRGQRLLVTDVNEVALMDVREIRLTPTLH